MAGRRVNSVAAVPRLIHSAQAWAWHRYCEVTYDIQRVDPRELPYEPRRFDAVMTSVATKMPPLVRREIWYTQKHRRLGHLRHPRSFTEKVNWRILYDRRPLLAWTCDKLRMKEEAARHGVLTPQTYWSGCDLRELVHVPLPEHWVLKPNHRSALVHIGRGPVGDRQVYELERLTCGWLEETQNSLLGEWAYSQARRCFLVEEMIGGGPSPPTDYKFFVFGGRPYLIHVTTNRLREHLMRYYTPSWEPLSHYSGYPLGAVSEAPRGLDEMLRVAALLGKPFDFMRIDLYNVGDAVYLGEFTPYPHSGMFPYWPRVLDREIGALWTLPEPYGCESSADL